jgi:hypothetical protein
VVHAGESLAFGLEAFKEDVVGDADADELDSDKALEGSGLFGQPDLAHAAFAEFAHRAIRPDETGGGIRGVRLWRVRR